VVAVVHPTTEMAGGENPKMGMPVAAVVIPIVKVPAAVVSPVTVEMQVLQGVNHSQMGVPVEIPVAAIMVDMVDLAAEAADIMVMPLEAEAGILAAIRAAIRLTVVRLG
jgi:hypothetical protein